MLGWLQEQGEIIDDCLVGEPTNPDVLGDMIKIGRRGSVNGVVTVTGTQGHVAYPHLADNPVPQLVTLMAHLAAGTLDDGSEHFQPSNLEITSVDVGNGATNVIPGQAEGRFNIRYNDHWDKDKITAWIEARLDEAAGEAGYALELSHTGDCFLTEPGPFVETLSTAIEEVTVAPRFINLGRHVGCAFHQRHKPRCRVRAGRQNHASKSMSMCRSMIFASLPKFTKNYWRDISPNALRRGQ